MKLINLLPLGCFHKRNEEADASSASIAEAKESQAQFNKVSKALRAANDLGDYIRDFYVGLDGKDTDLSTLIGAANHNGPNFSISKEFKAVEDALSALDDKLDGVISQLSASARMSQRSVTDEKRYDK